MKNIYLLIILFSVNVSGQTQNLFYEDFNDGLEGWTAVNLTDSTAPTLWRVTNTRYVSPSHSVGWNDSLTNSYSDLRYEALDSPPITIPYNTRTFMKFKAFIHLTLNGTYFHDYFFVKYTTNNGTTWNNFLPYAVSGQQLTWRSFPEDFGPTASGELTYYAGKTMRFRFITRSDSLDPNGLGVFLDDVHIYTNPCEFFDVNEPNNNVATATPVNLGDIVSASLCPQNDEDVYKFTAQVGDQLNLVTQHSMVWTYLYLMNSNGITLKYAYNEMTYNVTIAGTYYIRVTGSYNYSANYSIYFNSRPEPDVISVTDIPDDQGLQVRVKWQASFYDPQNGNGKILEYQLWRKVNDTLNLSSRNNIKKLSSQEKGMLVEEYWEYMVSVPALSGRPFVNYSYTAPTLGDNLLTTFKIAAIPKVETLPITWGLEGSGFSIDNLSPGILSFHASNSSNGIKLDWKVNTLNHDVVKYEIYKGIHELFPPLPEYKITSLNPSTFEYVDKDLLTGYKYYYIISVTDKAGNTTYSPAFSAGTVTSVNEESFTPKEIVLKQNYPNPFNPVTTIEFSLPSVTKISLKIYDVLGREIKEIAHGTYNPGNHKAEFNAADLTSGIYFYTLSGNNQNETRKLLLLK